MSIQAVAWAIQTRVGDTALKVLLIAICNYADEDWKCWPSQDRLAHDSEVSKRTIQRALKKLEAQGLVTIEARRHADGTQASSMIHIHRDAVVTGGQIVTQSGGQTAGSQNEPAGGQNGGSPVDTKESTYKKPSENHQLEPSNGTSRARAEVFFDEQFWPNYPKRDGSNPKDPARKKIISVVVSGENPDLILEGLRRLVQDLRRRNRIGTEFVPMAVTWINRKGWRDDPTDLAAIQRPKPDRPMGFFAAAAAIRAKYES